MARISGVEIPDNKRAEIALQYIFGLGSSRSCKVLEEADVDKNSRIAHLTDQQLDRIRAVINQGYKIEGDLRKEVSLNIKRLRDIRCYRGIRHQSKLPANGQKTKNNARTCKGKRKTVANKKKAPAKK